MCQDNNSTTPDDRPAYWKIFLSILLVFCLISFCGYMWGQHNPHDPPWIIIAFFGIPAGVIGCALRDI